MNSDTQSLIREYYAAFNAGDMQRFLDFLHEQVAHDLNQGGREIGRAAFGRFMQRMNRCYREQIIDLVVMVNGDGNRAATKACRLQTGRNTSCPAVHSSMLPTARSRGSPTITICRNGCGRLERRNRTEC
jgi:steroid delta-isomerase-like uncharacterized protein